MLFRSRIVLALRRDYLNPLQALELPQIDPANWASWHLRRAAAPIAESKRQAGTTEPPPWLFPTSDELAALDEAVSQLATELGVKRQSDHDRWRMFKRLEHDYSRLKLRAFAQALSKRVENVPGRSADLNLIHRHNDGYNRPYVFVEAIHPAGSLKLTESPAPLRMTMQEVDEDPQQWRMAA